MSELYENMSFIENPFSRFSAEEEKDYLHKIFVQPKYYPTISSDIKSGASRFIFGERGVGKSALVLNLIEDFSEKQVFSILIDDYEGIELTDNGKTFLIFTLRKMVTSFGAFLCKNKQCLKSLDKEEKEKLTIFINIFFETLSKKQFTDLYNKTTHIKSVNMLKKFFNYFLLKPTNTILSGCSELIGHTISRALGLPEQQQLNPSIYKEYITELKDTEYLEKIDPNNLEYRVVKSMLLELSLIIKKCGFKGNVVIYDKIDEYPSLGTQISSIANFTKDLILDTSLLLNSNISLVFSFWNKIRDPLTDLGVRYDKLKPVDITWTDAELEKIIGDRLSYFSNKKITSLKQIIPEKYMDTVLQLANCSPRHLIILLSKIYDEQGNIDNTNRKFSNEAVEKGLSNFSKTFDFGTYYAGTSLEAIRKTVNEILKVNKIEFETKDLIATFKISSQAANNKIKIMRGYGLIEEIPAGTRAKKYRIVEPRIVYIIDNNLKEPVA